MEARVGLPPTTDLLLTWDATRPRSRQAELGMSAIGGCRRRAGYILAGQEREGPGGSVQAVLGTAIHETASQVARAALFVADIQDTMVEQEVRFAGILGHLDLYFPPVVRDVKTLGYTSQLARYRVEGPPRHDIWQVSLYAAALISTDRPVERVQLDYIARDSGDTWLWEAPFHVEPVREAMAWLRTVRDTPVEYLARDFRPDSAVCQACPFRRACWETRAVDGRSPLSVYYVDEPDAVLWTERLEDARRRREEAEHDEAVAKGALDALRPNDIGTALVDTGADMLLRFTVVKGRELPDTDRIRGDYARAGGEMPVRHGESSVRVNLVAR